MAEFNKNLWAPWRMEYIRSLRDEVTDDGCFLCRYWSDPSRDADHHVLWRTPTSFVVMNRFPYTNGHLLIAHFEHKGEITKLTDEELAALIKTTRDGVAILQRTINPDGFNVGFNLGRCAGAGLPEHLHAHVVPRWSGDTNFMAVIDNTRTIPDSLDALCKELIAAASSLNLR